MKWKTWLCVETNTPLSLDIAGNPIFQVNSKKEKTWHPFSGVALKVCIFHIQIEGKTEYFGNVWFYRKTVSSSQSGRELKKFWFFPPQLLEEGQRRIEQELGGLAQTRGRARERGSLVATGCVWTEAGFPHSIIWGAASWAHCWRGIGRWHAKGDAARASSLVRVP